MLGVVYLDAAFIGHFDLAESPIWQLTAAALVVGWLTTLALSIVGIRFARVWRAAYWVTIIALAVELLLTALFVASMLAFASVPI